MTISAARLAANRRNARKSTGPVTQEGRDRVRLNAWKHGFRSESGLEGPGEAEAVADRRQQWAGAFPTSSADGYQRWLVDQITLASVRIDRCQDHQRTQARYEADRASSCWDVDRLADAAELGSRLANDPDRVVSQLCRSEAGIDWLLCRWRSLGNLLEPGPGGEGPPGWDDAHCRLCLDLMQTPDEFRDSDREWLSALPLDDLRDFVREQVDHLESLRETASSLDESGRALAELGLPTTEHSHLRRLRSYENALWRRFRSLERSYRERRSQDPEASADDLDDDPIGDLLSYAELVESGLEPEPIDDSPPALQPASAPSPCPPGPRPDRSAIRALPTPTPMPTPTPTPSEPLEAPDSDLRPTPSPESSPRVRLAEPPVLQNRRARRARKKRLAAGRR